MRRYIRLAAMLAVSVLSMSAAADFSGEMVQTELEAEIRHAIGRGTSIEQVVASALKVGVDPSAIMITLDNIGVAPQVVTIALTKAASAVGVAAEAVPAWLAETAVNANLDPTAYIAAAAAGPTSGSESMSFSAPTTPMLAPIFSGPASTLSGGGGGRASVSRS